MTDASRELLIRAGWVLLALLALVWGARIVQRAITRRVDDAPTRYRLRQFISWGAWIVALAVVVAAYSESLGQLGVVLGVAGAGIAFALQEVIGSVAGWIAVSLGGFYRVGDRVQLGGIRGDVVDIGVLRTTLMELGEWVDGDQYNGRIVRVANSFVFKEPVFNYSSDFPFVWDEIKVRVTYESDRALARSLLLEAARSIVGDYAEDVRSAWDSIVRKYPIEPARLRPSVTVAATDNWLEYTVRYAVDYKARRSTRDRLFESIGTAVEATEGRVGLASATFALVDAPPLDVRLTHGAPTSAGPSMGDDGSDLTGVDR